MNTLSGIRVAQVAINHNLLVIIIIVLVMAMNFGSWCEAPSDTVAGRGVRVFLSLFLVLVSKVVATGTKNMANKYDARLLFHDPYQFVLWLTEWCRQCWRRK